MSNKRNFIQYEAPVFSKIIEKNRAFIEAHNIKVETKIVKTQSADLSKKLTEEEILEAFDQDLTATFFKRNHKEKENKKNEISDKKNENIKVEGNLLSSLMIHKLNFKLDAQKKIDEVREEKNEKIENLNKTNKNAKKLVVFRQNFSFSDNLGNFIKEKEQILEKTKINQKTLVTENKESSSKELVNQIENLNIETKELEKENPSINLEKTGEPSEQSNKENQINPEKEKTPKKPRKPKKNPQKAKKTQKKPQKNQKKANQEPNRTEPEELGTFKPHKYSKKPIESKKPKPENEDEDVKAENEKEKKPKKNLKKIHEKNENLVRLNLKKIYKDRFRGQVYNYKNHYTANGRPKQPQLFGRNKIIHIKSYKIEQLLSNSNPDDIDPYLSSLSESLKIPVIMPYSTALKNEVLEDFLPMIPEKDPIDFTDDDYHEILKKNFGFDEFRPGQLESIKKIVSGKSTLVILHTGLGKSLIYSIASLLMPGLTVVISPLISLMFDQIDKLPKCLPGACINGMLKPENKGKIYELIRNQKLKILYISPETLETSFILDLSTQINFVCIDEIHCVSEWSHNFRTSYLKLSYLIKDRLKTELVLGLTATATSRTISSITKLFKINEVVQSNIINRSNLNLTTSRDQDKFPSLLTLLRTPKFHKLKSIIIYCTLIRTTENVSNYLSQSGVPAIPYHSECHESTRLKIQKQFMSGQVRIVVATLAFGMGIDKRDVDGIIHLNMPKSLENYIQEVGRAGRNGRPAFCHLFLTDEDYYRMRGYILSESLDECILRKLIQRVFQKGMKTQEVCSSKRKGIEENKEDEDNSNSLGKIAYILETDLCSYLECNASMLMTVLLKIEEFTNGKFEIFPLSKIACNLRFYKTAVSDLLDKYDIIKKALSLARNMNGTYHLNLIKLSNLLEQTPLEIMREIQKIAMKEGISFELNSPAFCFRVKEELEEEKEMENLIEYILRKTNEVERQMLYKVIYNNSIIVMKDKLIFRLIVSIWLSKDPHIFQLIR